MLYELPNLLGRIFHFGLFIFDKVERLVCLSSRVVEGHVGTVLESSTNMNKTQKIKCLFVEIQIVIHELLVNLLVSINSNILQETIHLLFMFIGMYINT